jgi:hypothetical protein
MYVQSTTELTATKLDETYCVSYVYEAGGTTHNDVDPLSGQPASIPRV